MNITLEEWQGQLDEIDNQVKELKTKKDNLISVLSDKGFDYHRGKLSERVDTYGMFYDMSLYSHFDGHLSEAVYNDISGADEISKEDFDILKGLIEEYHKIPKPKFGDAMPNTDELEEKASWCIKNTKCDWIYDDMLRHFKVVDDDTLEWEYNGPDDQGYIVSGSNFVVKRTTKKEIASTKRVDKWYND